MRTLPAMIALGLALAAPAWASSDHLTPATIQNRLDSEGPAATVKWIWAHKARSQAVLQGIESGATGWLKIQRRLRGGADAGAAEDLDISLSRALQRNPAGVLRLIGDDAELRATCRDNDIEPTPDQARRFKARAIAALARVREPGLARKRDICVSSLRGD